MAESSLIQNNCNHSNIVIVASNGLSTSSDKTITTITATAPAQTNTNKHRDNDFNPPDGGARAWLVMISAFLCNSILFGVINTYGVIYLNLQEKLTARGDLEASSKAGKFYFLFIFCAAKY